MYRVVYFDNPYRQNPVVLHEPESYGAKILGGHISLSLDNIDSASFSVPFSNELYGNFKLMTDFIEVIDQTTKARVFYGRISKINSSVSNDGRVITQITCESRLAYLLDSLQVFRIANHTNVKDFFTDLIHAHNSQVEEYKRFEIGNIEIGDNDNILRGISTASTMDNIKEKLISRLGGYLKLTDNTINYVKNIGVLQETPIILGKNVVDAQREYSPENLFTRLYPFGAEIIPKNEDKNNEFGNPRIDISDVNDGKKYLDNDELKAFYGVIEKSIIFDDVHDKNILKNKGLKTLNDEKFQQISWTINVLDLALIDIAFERLRLGNRHNIIIPVLSKNEQLQIIAKEIDITAPQRSTLTFGKSKLSISQIKKEDKEVSLTVNSLNERINTIGGATEEVIQKFSEMTNIVNNNTESISLLNNSSERMNTRISNVNESVDNVSYLLTQHIYNYESFTQETNNKLVDLQKQINDLKPKN